MKQERTKDWVRLLPWAVLTMNAQESSPTAYTPHELFHGGCPAWFFKSPFPEDYKSPVGDWLESEQVDVAKNIQKKGTGWSIGWTWVTRLELT